MGFLFVITILMPKRKLNLHIYGIHLLNPYKTVVRRLKSLQKLNLDLYTDQKFNGPSVGGKK